ncbi:MAG: DNA methyltransferase, partial [Methyloligellaceae bacterium]
WQIRDTIMWVYGEGMPKSLDISKAIDRAAGAKREVLATESMKGSTELSQISPNRRCLSCGKPRQSADPCQCPRDSGPATEAAKRWIGFGSGLKPSFEPICVAMKPVEKNFAHNALKHGVAGFNIDGARVPTDGENPSGDKRKAARKSGKAGTDLHSALNARAGIKAFNKDIEAYCESRPGESLGRWPANLIHDGSPEVMSEFAKADIRSAGAAREKVWYITQHFGVGQQNQHKRKTAGRYGDNGTAARFFYCSKASKAERGNGNTHPTCKPITLMRYLLTLTKTPTGGIILDPFMGSGSTLVAALQVGRPAIGIELDESYCEIAVKRLSHVQKQLVLET